MDEKHKIFNQLMDSSLPMLRRAAYRILGNASDSDEAVQNALLKAWNNYDSFRKNAKFASWVYRVTINECFELLRKRKREKAKLERYAEIRISQSDQSDERLVWLQNSIAELPPLYRTALVTGVLSGMSADEAANVLECSANTLYQRIHKAKEMLKSMMKRS